MDAKIVDRFSELAELLADSKFRLNIKGRFGNISIGLFVVDVYPFQPDAGLYMVFVRHPVHHSKIFRDRIPVDEYVGQISDRIGYTAGEVLRIIGILDLNKAYIMADITWRRASQLQAQADDVLNV